jgi:two-component system, NarL family, nitrate/nitrite response regulator NarL
MPENCHRILIVDYDPGRAAQIAQALADCGAIIAVLPSAGDALEMCRNPAERVDLVLTRIVLEPMTGLDLAEAIERENLPAKVLLISHYRREILCTSDRFRKLSRSFIQDPASREQIRARVITALGVRAGEPELPVGDLQPGVRPIGGSAAKDGVE